MFVLVYFYGTIKSQSFTAFSNLKLLVLLSHFLCFIHCFTILQSISCYSSIKQTLIVLLFPLVLLLVPCSLCYFNSTIQVISCFLLLPFYLPKDNLMLRKEQFVMAGQIQEKDQKLVELQNQALKAEQQVC